MTQAQAKTYCATYLVRGLSGFHLTSIDELRTFAYGCPRTALGGSCPISEPSCLTEECGEGPECSSCIGSQTSDYMNPDLPPTFLFPHTTSNCSDCTGPDTEWTYLPGNGNFGTQDPASYHFAACVLENVPDALP